MSDKTIQGAWAGGRPSLSCSCLLRRKTDRRHRIRSSASAIVELNAAVREIEIRATADRSARQQSESRHTCHSHRFDLQR